MLGLEDFMTIQALAQRGVYLCDIAAQLGVHPKTVRPALERGGPPAPPQGRRGSLLDPYRPLVDQRLAEGVWNAVVLVSSSLSPIGCCRLDPTGAGRGSPWCA